ncbi:MAG: hypothetical protein H0W88_09575 [Parachlamydiaceae bacterium]|nr:hypothetical protein [Parachlamydiaceae bacterium]MBA3722636.1 hypothetical protein [Parachlamydiaceae bacterium]
MIELTFATGFMLYLCFTLTVVLGFWGYQHYHARKKNIFTHEQELRVCEYCQFAYLEEGLKKVNKCPQCGSFNKNNIYNK